MQWASIAVADVLSLGLRKIIVVAGPDPDCQRESHAAGTLKPGTEP